MAYKYKKKRSFKKKFTRKRKSTTFRGAKRMKTAVTKRNVQLGLGFPKRVTQVHKYRETFYVTCTGGAFNYYVFKANGMYDPNASGAGHQPLYFDQMAALYDQYTVIGSKCTFKFCANETPVVASRCTAYVNDDNSVTPSSVDFTAEQSAARRIVVIPPGDTDAHQTTLKWSAKKYFPGSVLANNSLQGSGGSDPSETSTFVIAFQPSVTGTQTYMVIAEVEYIAVWYELKDVANS